MSDADKPTETPAAAPAEGEVAAPAADVPAADAPAADAPAEQAEAEKVCRIGV